jgi:Tfp pilus assembly protein PilO
VRESRLFFMLLIMIVLMILGDDGVFRKDQEHEQEGRRDGDEPN